MERLPFDDFISRLSLSLSIPEEDVRSILTHHLKSFSSFLSFPTYSAYRISALGLFQIMPFTIYNCILTLTKKLRKEFSYENYDILKHFFKNRHILTSYYHSRRFKKRFGSWHYK